MRSITILATLTGILLLVSPARGDVANELTGLKTDVEARIAGGTLDAAQTKALEKILTAIGKAEAIEGNLPKYLKKVAGVVKKVEGALRKGVNVTPHLADIRDAVDNTVADLKARTGDAAAVLVVEKHRQKIEKQIAELVDLSVESVRRELPRRPRHRDEEPILHELYEHWGAEEHLLALVLRGEVAWDAIDSHIVVEDFSTINQPIAERLAAGVTDLSELMTELDEEGARRASFYALAPLEIDVEQAIEDARRWMGRLPAIEKRLVVIGREIAASGEAEDWKRWEELVKEKEELRVAWKQARKGIHEQQDKEKRS